jgi:ParB-like chromosome segregation protein Spo0J
MPALVARYAEFLADLPPIEVNQRHELIDGWHRLEAHKQAGTVTIRVVVTMVANDVEHLCVACLRNATHGLQLPIEQEREARALGRQRWPRQRIADGAGHRDKEKDGAKEARV